MTNTRFPLFLSMVALACNDKGGDTAAEGVDANDLGEFTTDAEELTPEIAFDVPSGASSVVVYCGPFGDSLIGTAWDIKDPAGELIYTNAFHESYAPSKMRVGNLDDLVPVVMPVSPDLDITSGTYSMRMWVASGGTPTTFSCKALYRTGSVSNTGTVDLHFVFVGATVDAATAPSDADFTAALDKVGQWWGAADLDIGEVTYEDFSGDVTKYQVTDIDSEFNDLLRTSAPGKAQVLTIFMVEELTSSDGATILGQSAGPPGLPTVHGTSKSGMVVTTASLHDSPDEVALIIAHEGGHFLGLFHTTDKDGETHDPLSDTPECPASNDADSSGSVTPSECAGMGAENVMFWAAETTATDMSADQSWVLRRNPAVR